MEPRVCFTLLFVALFSLAAACGDVIVDNQGTGGSGAGPATTSSSSSSTDGGSGAPCDTFGGAQCNPEEYCSFSDGWCGGGDIGGVCLPRRDGCTRDCPGVCGCDGQFYCNACNAHQAGIDVAAGVFCSAGSEYRAYFWPGGLDHLIVYKADLNADRCVMLFADWPIESSPEYDITLPDGWGISQALVTDRASDCAASGQIVGQIVTATGGSGKLWWDVIPGTYGPCQLDIEATITFANAPAWVAPSEPLAAAAVSVEGGCP